MRSSTASLLLAPCLIAACLLLAQTRPAAAPKKKSAAITAKAGAPKKKSALDKTTLEAYIRHLFVWGPAVKIEIRDPKPGPVAGFQEVGIRASAGLYSQDEIFYVSSDGQKILRGQFFNVNDNPFRDDLNKLKTEFQPSMGTPGAPVVVVAFSDFQCPHCKDEAKMLRQNLVSAYPKQARLYFKDFPLEQIHPWAKTAAIAGRCIFRQNPGEFWEFFDWIFEHQNEITPENAKAKLAAYAGGRSSQIDGLQFGRCLDTRATEAEVDKNIAEAKALQIVSLPTLFINGRRAVGSQGWPAIRQIIDYELEYQKTAQNAGESACCELKIPSPLNK